MPAALAFRAIILFAGGCITSILYNHLLKEHHVYTLNDQYYIYLGSIWWIPIWAGLGVLFIGLALPAYDTFIGTPHGLNREWSSVIRCVGVHTGLFYACAKLPNVTNVQMSLLMSLLAVSMWWVFDRSTQGFRLALLFTITGTVAMHCLVFLDVLRYTQPDFYLVRSWIPAMMFSAGVTFGSVGRQLAITTDSYLDTARASPKLDTHRAKSD